MLGVLHIDTMKGWRGGERQASYLAEALHRRGYSVGFACQPGSELEKRFKNTGVQVHPVRFRCEADFTAAWRMAGLVRRHDYKLLHMHDSHAHWLGACAARFSGMPLRVVSRRVDFSIHRHGFGLSIIKYRHFADAFIAVSEAVRQALIKDGVPGEKIHVVRSGIGMGQTDKQAGHGALRRMLGTNGSTRIIGSVGSLVGHKGHRYFIEAASEIIKHKPDVRFVILGEGKLRRVLESQIVRSGLSGKFLLPGHLPAASTLIMDFDVFVMPSLQEGLGSSMLDAMALGVPVVASRAGGIPEVVEDMETGLLAEPGDIGSLAKAVQKILDGPELARRLTSKAREKVSGEFTVARMVEKTSAVYDSLMRERG